MPPANIVRIRIKGYLRPEWSEWFDGMTISHDEENQTTVITGPMRDQAVLNGLLNKVFALGLALISVTPTEGNDATSGP